MDAWNRNPSQTKSREKLSKLMDEAKLCDVWRDRNENVRRYTWKKTKPRVVCSRLDFFLINQEISTCVEECDIVHVTNTDHKMITLSIKHDDFIRGPGTWKFNTLHLKNDHFLEVTRNVITENLNAASQLNIIESWEFTKEKLIKHCKKFAKTAAQAKSKQKLDLTKTIEILNEDLLKDNSTDNRDIIIEAIHNIELELESLAQEKVNSAVFRSRAQFVKEGEKNSKYFFSLEKRNFFNKNMRSVRKENGKVIRQQSRILKEQHNFYKELYSENKKVKFDMTPQPGERLLDEEQIKMLSTPLELAEITAALKGMKDNKSPGLDGLPKEFYVQFFDLIGPVLLKVFHECLTMGKLHTSARKGLISLIPKKNTDAQLLKSWRPLTLLSLDFKILSKSMAERMKKVLPSIISEEQSGFMAGRSASQCIRRTLEVIQYAKNNRLPAAILIIDFNKCFDRLNHSAIEGALNYFKFPKQYISWVKLFFADLQIYNQNFGFLSDPFTKKQGSNQGCNISPFCFLLCGELMARKLKQDPSIKGINIKGFKQLLSQFADDTTLYLTYDKITFERVVDTLSYIEDQTGLRISFDKTVVYRIGSLANSMAKIYTKKDLSWTNDPISILGVKMSNDMKEVDNYEAVLEKMQTVLHNWYYRQMTLMGKVLIVNTLCESLFVYKLTVLANISPNTIKKIEEIVNSFIWKGKRAKISADTLKCHKKHGGVRLLDISKKQKSLKINWIPTIVKDSFFEMCFFQGTGLPVQLSCKVFHCNMHVRDATKMCKKENFWSQIWLAWCDFTYDKIEESNIMTNVIWLNSQIRINNKPYFNVKAFENGIWTISDICNTHSEDGFKSFQELPEGCLTWLDYASIKAAIPNNWKLKIKECGENVKRDSAKNVTNFDTISSGKIYQKLIENDSMLSKYCNRWIEKGTKLELEDYSKCFRDIYVITDITKLRDFQYRLLLGKTPMKDELFTWGIAENYLCSFCKTSKETVDHVFSNCKFTTRLWKALNYITDIQLLFEQDGKPCWDRILLNTAHTKTKHVANFITLLTKQFIYRHCCQQQIPTISKLKREIILYYKIEKFIATNTNRIAKFHRKWKNIDCQLLNLT